MQPPNLKLTSALGSNSTVTGYIIGLTGIGFEVAMTSPPRLGALARGAGGPVLDLWDGLPVASARPVPRRAARGAATAGYDRAVSALCPAPRATSRRHV